MISASWRAGWRSQPPGGVEVVRRSRGSEGLPEGQRAVSGLAGRAGEWLPISAPGAEQRLLACRVRRRSGGGQACSRRVLQRYLKRLPSGQARRGRDRERAGRQGGRHTPKRVRRCRALRGRALRAQRRADVPRLPRRTRAGGQVRRPTQYGRDPARARRLLAGRGKATAEVRQCHCTSTSAPSVVRSSIGWSGRPTPTGSKSVPGAAASKQSARFRPSAGPAVEARRAAAARRASAAAEASESAGPLVLPKAEFKCGEDKWTSRIPLLRW